jgi:tetratricopeptide (TPR) repeat protein
MESREAALFLTQEKVLKRIHQDRGKGDLKRAKARALDGLKKWPDDYELAMEAVQLCFDLNDSREAVSLLKTALKRHPKKRAQVMNLAREQFAVSSNPLLGGFIIEVMMRSRSFEAVQEIIRKSPPSFINDLIKRSEIRSKGAAQQGKDDSPVQTDNELLLGLLYAENKQYDLAVSPLGKTLELSPENAQTIGVILVTLEQELPRNAEVKYYLGLASLLLDHPEKAEARFFQCLELENPPLDKLLTSIESMVVHTGNHHLLKGETLIRLGRTAEGTASIKEYLEGGDSARPQSMPGTFNQPAPEGIDKSEVAFHRLSLLGEDAYSDIDLTFLYCGVSAKRGHVQEAVEALERLFREDNGCTAQLIQWIESNDAVRATAPAQNLLTLLYIENEQFEKASKAARTAADMNPSQIPFLIDRIGAVLENSTGDDAVLRVALAELYARGGNAESAEETLKQLHEVDAVDKEEIFRLTAEIMQHCGITFVGVSSAIDIGIQSRDVSMAVPHMIEFCREHADEGDKLASEIRRIAEQNENSWPSVSELLDTVAREEQLSKDLRRLQALAHLQIGEVERAVFEFDQLLMLDDALRGELVAIYEDAVARNRENTTLHLALYHLYLEEEQLAKASHYLCKTLEFDPGQIKDVLTRFFGLVEREPANMGIWEEMLKTALAIHHVDLAKDVLKRSIKALPKDEAAALHIYGARILSIGGKTADSLKCIAMALTSRHADLELIEGELRSIMARDPENPESRYLFGEAMLRLGKEMEADSAFRDCLKISDAYNDKVRERLERQLPTSVKPWLISNLLGEIAWIDGCVDDALRYFTIAQQGPRESIPELGRTLENLGVTGVSDSRFKLLYAKNLSLEGRCKELSVLLEELVDNDDHLLKPAVDILAECLEKHPGQTDANRLYARILIRCGDREKSLEPVLRLLDDDDSSPAEISEAIAEFLSYHSDRTEFQLPYGRLKARNEEFEEAYSRFKHALELSPDDWEAIARAIDETEWPDTLAGSSGLLAVDCLLAGDRPEDAFDILRTMNTGDTALMKEVAGRIRALTERKPERDHYLFGCSLLVRMGEIDLAEQFAGAADGILDEAECTDLKIMLADTMQDRGYTEKASVVFKEVLDKADDKLSVLKRIENASAERAAREISESIEKINRGEADDEEQERTIRLALDGGLHKIALDVLSRSSLSGKKRIALLARTYLGMDRPVFARAVAASVDRSDSTEDDLNIELLYLDGVTSERLGDYGRAASAFMKILPARGEYLDCRERAGKNYTRFMESQIDEKAAVIEKTTSLTTDV